MASLILCPQFETNLVSNRKVIELLLQLKSANAHGKTYIKVKPYLVRHLLGNCLLFHGFIFSSGFSWSRKGTLWPLAIFATNSFRLSS